MSDIKLPLAKRLQESRLQLGMTQKEVVWELKQRYGISARQSYLSQLESGVKDAPSLPLLVALAHVLDTSTDYLLGITDNPLTIREIEEDAQAGGAEGRISQILARLPREKQDELLRVAEGFIYRNMIDLLLTEVETIGGETALNEALDRLEASLPGSARRLRPSASTQSR